MAAITAFAPAMMLAFRVNGGVQGREALLVAVVLSSIAASTAYDPLERIETHVGKDLFRLRWPVSRAERAAALALLVALLLAPGMILIGLFASTMGAMQELVFLLSCALNIVLCASSLSFFLGTTRSSVGQYLLLLVGHGALIFLLPSGMYALLALVCIPSALRFSALRLRTFAIGAERTTVERVS